MHNFLRVDALYSFVIASVCCLRGEEHNDTSTNLLCFSENSLATCQEVLKIRKSNPALKYSNVELPQTIPSTIGYHKACYKRFIGLSEKYRDSDASSSNKSVEDIVTAISTRSTAKPLKTNELGIFPRICLICNKIRKKKKNVEQPLVNAQTKDIENSVKKYATWLNDEDMLRKVSGVDFVAKEIVYHAVCRKDYQATAEATPMGKVGKIE